MRPNHYKRGSIGQLILTNCMEMGLMPYDEVVPSIASPLYEDLASTGVRHYDL